MENNFYICQTKDSKDLPLPKYMTAAAAGMDLYANVTDKIIIEPGCAQLIPTGIKIAMPVGFEAQIRPRSGLALKSGVTLLNSPGTIDADYRGEIKVIAINHGREAFTVRRGDRIAQMVINKIETVQFIETNQLDLSERGEGGFGHTGV